MDPNQSNQFALIGLVTGIIGAFTGIFSLIITAIKELFRDRPIIKVYEIHSKNKFGCTIEEIAKPENENIYHVRVTVHALITNTGLRPTSIINSKLLFFSKNKFEVFNEKETQEDVYHENISFSHITGYKLESADFMDCYTAYESYIDKEFPLKSLHGQLIIYLSHTDKPLHLKKINLESVIAWNQEGDPCSITEFINDIGIIVKPIWKNKI